MIGGFDAVHAFYTLSVLPCLLSIALNGVVIWAFRRSPRLRDHPIPFRLDLALALVLGNAIYVMTALTLVILPNWTDSDGPCRAVSFGLNLGLSGVRAACLLAVIERYFAASSPYGRIVSLVLSVKNLNFILWPVALVVNLPYIFLKGAWETDDFSICLFIYGHWELVTLMVKLILHPLTPLVYAAGLHLLLNRLDSENNGDPPPNTYARVLRRGTGFARTFVLGYIVVYTPMLVLQFLWGDFGMGLYSISYTFCLLSVFISIAEPICFAIQDEAVWDECKDILGASRKRKFQDQQHRQTTATPPTIQITTTPSTAPILTIH